MTHKDYDMTNRQLVLENIDRIDRLVYTPLERQYLRVRLVGTALTYIGLMVLPFFVFLADDFKLLLLPKACAYKGFAIREHDITYRTGIIFPSVTTVPFCKIQQVSIRQNPVSRFFGLYSVAVVNGAQLMTETAIPGLTRERAEEIKAFLIERTGNESK